MGAQSVGTRQVSKYPKMGRKHSSGPEKKRIVRQNNSEWKGTLSMFPPNGIPVMLSAALASSMERS